MKKILVTGANGFLGYYLVRQLLKQSFTVIATGKGPCRLPFNDAGFNYETLDFSDRASVQSIISKHLPDTIVHCGALSKPDECERNKEAAFLTNVTATIYLLEAAAAIQASFIFLSTDFVFSGEKGMYKEDDERAPVNYYGLTKVLAEDEVMRYAGAWAIVRTVLVYGRPFLSRQNLLTTTAESLRNGKRSGIFNDQVRTPTFVEDLAEGIVSMINLQSRGIYHLSGKDVLTPYEMAVAVARHLDLDASLIDPIVEDDLQQPARRPLKTGLDISKAVKDLAYEPIDFYTGLQRTFE